ncbi:hypothetical protein BDW02DRAFT_330299 [Decorospora gaudefroyi]|uniref:Uncharacterized protein n=1 Tax=Decorospora gaudefroyi TaxID=184978 RepID=A0A6A5K9P9_9PLEO|nr:hypothetical protein BDW02DRAFT_330299 [Decorospora gaudefroyi]
MASLIAVANVTARMVCYARAGVWGPRCGGVHAPMMYTASVRRLPAKGWAYISGPSFAWLGTYLQRPWCITGWLPKDVSRVSTYSLPYDGILRSKQKRS